MSPDYLARLFQQRSQTRLVRFDEQTLPKASAELLMKKPSERRDSYLVGRLLVMKKPSERRCEASRSELASGVGDSYLVGRLLDLTIPASVPEEFEEKMLRDMRAEDTKGDDTK